MDDPETELQLSLYSFRDNLAQRWKQTNAGNHDLRPLPFRAALKIADNLEAMPVNGD